MSMVQIGALNVSQTSYNRARDIVNNKPEGRKTAQGVLESLRKMMPGWTIVTDSSQWTAGVRNIEIDYDVLERMAEDPEAMVKFKALILDLEDVAPTIEAWKAEHPDTTLRFKFDIGQDGNLWAIATLLTSLDQEVTNRFELYEHQTTWAGIIERTLDALAQSQVTDAEGNRSWMA